MKSVQYRKDVLSSSESKIQTYFEDLEYYDLEHYDRRHEQIQKVKSRTSQEWKELKKKRKELYDEFTK